MAMLRICATDGCGIKTLGEYCIHHDGPREVPVARRLWTATGVARGGTDVSRNGPAGTETIAAAVSTGVRGER